MILTKSPILSAIGGPLRRCTSAGCCPVACGPHEKRRDDRRGTGKEKKEERKKKRAINEPKNHGMMGQTVPTCSHAAWCQVTLCAASQHWANCTIFHCRKMQPKRRQTRHKTVKQLTNCVTTSIRAASVCPVQSADCCSDPCDETKEKRWTLVINQVNASNRFIHLLIR